MPDYFRPEGHFPYSLRREAYRLPSDVIKGVKSRLV